MNSEEYQETRRDLGGQSVRIASYRIGERFFCHVDNVDPGATIARTHGATREEAEAAAIARVIERLGVDA